MPQKTFVIVAGQRTGTTALASNLAATGKFANFGEIFHTADTARPDSNFFSFVKRNEITLDQTAGHDGVTAIATEYFESLKSLAGQRHVLVDVKLNSWNALRPAWRYPTQIPFFLEFLVKQDAVFLFIIRRNLAEQILSERVARHLGKWHSLQESDQATFRAPPGMVVDQARLVLEAERHLYGFLHTREAFCRLVYEDMFLDTGLAPATGEQIAALLGQPLTFDFHSPIQKNKVTSRDVVENYSEIEARINEMISEMGRVY